MLSDGKISYWGVLRLIFQFRLFDVRGIQESAEELAIYANYKFYELQIKSLKERIEEFESWLKANDEKISLDRYVELSKVIFNGVLFNKYRELHNIEFNQRNYAAMFDEFVKRYPVVTSSTLSLHTSVPNDFLFDYVIIDEASQVDIVKSALCLSRSKCAVIVGDSMQLSHIVDEQSAANAEFLLQKYSVGDAYNYVQNSILNSVKKIYRDKIPCTLLREHYRCHPTIIGFCNKRYYNNELIVMTESDKQPFKIIETAITGASMNTNQRQADETTQYIYDNFADDFTQVGVVSPYRDQANLLQNQLPSEVLADTIHKFQGGEKRVIIFNTVRGKISSFLDNPNLINVAVSRAIEQFIVIKPASMELPHGTNIGDLIRYICYVGDPEQTIVKGSVCSVFDLLYKEYNQVFNAFIEQNQELQGAAAEKIVHKLMVELLSDPKYRSINFVREYRLRDLVREINNFNKEEQVFIRRNSRLDFLLYNSIDKSPILAIEVDGRSFHSNVKQRERDQKKSNILSSLKLPLLRLSTDGHSERERIAEELDKAINNC